MVIKFERSMSCLLAFFIVATDYALHSHHVFLQALVSRRMRQYLENLSNTIPSETEIIKLSETCEPPSCKHFTTSLHTPIAGSCDLTDAKSGIQLGHRNTLGVKWIISK